MKLDATDLRYILPEEFRVLKAVEQGCKTHHVVPSSVIAQLSGLQHSGLNKLMGSLAKRNLIAREQHIKYDGYRLTYGGYDFLAVRAIKEKNEVEAVGHRIGVGKESDIYLVSAPAPTHENRILKIHRLGRISFRAVKEKRDYTNKKANRQNFSWMYLSRLAAAKEFQFMQILHEHGFPVPVPIAQSRHSILMSLIDAYPLRQISAIPSDQVSLLYSALMSLIVRLARAGLIHGDFNEFNLLIKEIRNEDEDDQDDDTAFKADPTIGPFGQKVGTAPPPELKQGERWEKGNGFERVVADTGNPTSLEHEREDDEGEEDESESEEEDSDSEDSRPQEQIQLSDGSSVEPILIDFPQMISVLHPNAEYFFDRDVNCVRRFFRKRFRYISEEAPRFRDVVSTEWENERRDRERRREAKKEGEEREEDADLKTYLDLDVIAKASGYIVAEKKRGDREELDQYLARMRVGDADDDSDSEVETDDQDEDEGEEEEESEEEEDAPSEEDEATEESLQRSNKTKQPHGQQVRTTRRTKIDPRLIQQQVTNERSMLKSQSSKHHGKKNQSGKTGRTHPGGKGKSDQVKDSSLF
ncbi:unnamed protein product [Sympodiomycopsis kandeliae]